MAFIFLESWNLYQDTGNTSPTVAHVARRWNYVEGPPCTLRTSDGRWGGRCIRVDGNGELRQTFPACADATNNRFFFSFAIGVIAMPSSEGTGSFMLLRDPLNNCHLGLRVGTDGTLKVIKITHQTNLTGDVIASSAAGVISVGWQRVEGAVYIDATSGRVTINVSEIEVIDFTGDNVGTNGTGVTENVGGFSIRGLSLGGQGPSNSSHRLQDILLWNEDNDGPSDFIGDFLIPNGGIRPNANGNNIDGVAVGVGTAYQAVDDPFAPSSGDTDYQRLDNNGDYDLFDKADIAVGPIIAVLTAALVRSDGTEIRQLRLMTRSDGTDFDTGVNQAVPAQLEYTYRSTFWPVDPSTDDPWDQTTFNAAEFGYKRQA